MSRILLSAQEPHRILATPALAAATVPGTPAQLPAKLEGAAEGQLKRIAERVSHGVENNRRGWWPPSTR